jgi:hypothetical protein
MPGIAAFPRHPKTARDLDLFPMFLLVFTHTFTMPLLVTPLLLLSVSIPSLRYFAASVATFFFEPLFPPAYIYVFPQDILLGHNIVQSKFGCQVHAQCRLPPCPAGLTISYMLRETLACSSDHHIPIPSSTLSQTSITIIHANHFSHRPLLRSSILSIFGMKSFPSAATPSDKPLNHPQRLDGP